MFMRLENIPLTLIQYLETYAIPQAVGVQKFAMGVTIGVIALNGAKYVNNPTTKVKLTELGLLDKDTGLLDVTRAYELLKSGAKYSPKTNVYGVIIDQSDIESVYEIAKQFSEEAGVNEDV